MKHINVNKATHDEWLLKNQKGDLTELQWDVYRYLKRKVVKSTIYTAIKTGKGQADLIGVIMNYYNNK